MYVEKRPTAVTVIGWTWVVLGGFSLFVGATSIPLAFSDLDASSAALPGSALMVAGFFAQIVIGATGAVSGAALLRMKRWARPTLLALTSLVLALIVASVVAVLIEVFRYIGDASDALFVGGIFVFYAAMVFGLVLMIRSLAGAAMKRALEVPA